MKNNRKCPVCGQENNQVNNGHNRSGTQRVMCRHCGKTYTENPKCHAYTQETRELAIKMFYNGVSGRGVGNILGMDKSNVYNWIKKNSENPGE